MSSMAHSPLVFSIPSTTQQPPSLLLRRAPPPRLACPRQSTRKRVSVRRAMEPAGAGGREPSKEMTAKVTNSSGGPIAFGGGPRLPIPNIPTWAKWLLGSIVCLAVPFYKRLTKIEDGVEKAAETVVEVVEKVAEVAEKVATDIANALPANSKLREEVMEVEHFAEGVEKYAEKADEFIHKVDKITDEIEEVVDPIIEEGETNGKETQDKEKKEETGSSSNL